MYYTGEWIWKNIYFLDSHDMAMDLTHGDHCFLIGHHVKRPSVVNQTSAKLIKGGFHEFHIFGQQAHLWEEVLFQAAGPDSPIQIEASTVAREEMSYTLAMLARLEPQAVNFVLSDDECFTEYLVEDLRNIFSGKSKFSPHDWQKLRSGFEFKFHGKDAIVSVCNGVVVGFLGEEKIFDTINKGFRTKIFDGRSFYEVWEERAR